MLWDTIITSAWSTIGKATGFLIPFFIGAWFGINRETDAFFFAYSLILFLSAILSPVVETIVVPFIAEAKVKGEDIGAFIGKVLGLSAISLISLSILFLVVVKSILGIVTNFSKDGIDLIFLILIETSPLILLIVWTSILAGSLNAYRVFGVPAISPALRAVVTLAFIFIFKEQMGVHAIAWGYLAGEFFRFVFLFVVLVRLKLFHVKLSIGWEVKFADFFRTSSYQILGMTFLYSTPIVNKTMVTWVGSGGVSILEYADRLFLIPSNLLLMGLVTTILSHWSDRYYSRADEIKFKSDVYRVVKWVTIISIIITLLLLITRKSIIQSVYGYGKFPKDKLQSVEAVFSFYVIGLVFHAIHHILVRAHIVIKNTKTIFITASSMGLLNVILNFYLLKFYGVPGIAITTTLIYGLSILLLTIHFNRHFKGKYA